MNERTNLVATIAAMLFTRELDTPEIRRQRAALNCASKEDRELLHLLIQGSVTVAYCIVTEAESREA